MDVQRLSDERDIARLLTTYARAVDTKDWELYRSVFTEDAHIDYSSAGAVVGGRDEVVDWFAANFGVIPWSMHYITNVEIVAGGSGGQERSDPGDGVRGQERSDPGDGLGDSATVRAMFYNPMQLPGVDGMSACGGYYHHEMVRTPDGWRSRNLREENVWFTNGP